MANTRLKNITPKALNCGLGACPAMYETPHGTYVLIGRRATGSVQAELQAKIGPDEVAVEIPRDLLADLAH